MASLRPGPCFHLHSLRSNTDELVISAVQIYCAFAEHSTSSGSDASLVHDDDTIGHADGAINGSSNGGRANRVYKKGQAVHWLKLILYITQLGAHLSVALYYMLQDSAGPESWRWITQILLAVAWTVLLFGASVTLLLDDYGAVSVQYYQYMNAEYSAGLWSYFNFNWYTYVIDIGYERSIQTDDLPVLIDDDRTISVWKRFSKLLYTRGQNNVINGEDLKIGRRVMHMSGYRLYLQAFWSFSSAVLQVVPALALHEITQFMSDYVPNSGKKVPLTVILCVAGLFFSQAAATYADAMMFKIGRRLGIRAKAGLISAVFRKYIIGKLKSYQQALMKRRDVRMGVVNESMQGIRIIKLFAWEANFINKIFSARATEIAILRAFGKTLTAATGFTALTLFNQLRMPLSALPSTINEYIQ
eukprot:20800-Heterococcus_DN1.PRE.1